MTLFIYNFFLNLLSPFIILLIIVRVYLGKEDELRYKEKLGFSKYDKIKNKKKIWFHACSVGEVKSISKIINKFLTRNHNILVTTNTKLSAYYVKKEFSNRVKHQFLPVDFNYSTKKFLNFWKPSIGIFVESEIWPNLITNAKKMNITLVLLQANFSNKSLRNWSLLNIFFKDLLSSFKIIIAKSEEEKKKIQKYVDVIIQDTFNLKNSLPILKVEKNEVKKLKNDIKKNFIITALSTHPGEERIILEAFKAVKKKIKHAILIIQPRHPSRADKISKLISFYNFNFRQKSLSEYPKKNTAVYIADTFGESGTLISMSDLIILGGTLVPMGGHNIIESAQMAKCILIGKYFYKIIDTVELLKNNNAIKIINNNSDLSKNIVNLYNNKKKRLELGCNAFFITKTFTGKETKIVNKILSLNEN